MKRINNILLLTLTAAVLASCADEEVGPVVNPEAENGSLSFVLNQTQFSNFTYVLEQVNDALNMEVLTTSQPDYGFTAAVTYYVQVSFNEDLTDSVELASSVQGETVNINVREMNNAMFSLYNGDMPNPSVARDVYVRLRAIVSTATESPLVSVPTVKPLYSNIIKLNILPYFVENLRPFYEVDVLYPYYIIGYNGWDNSVAGLGSDIIPMSVKEGNHYNTAGQGEYVYTGYFESSKAFKVIGVIGGWTEQWGNENVVGIDNPIHNNGDSKDFQVPSNGYYTITLNSISNTISIESVDINPRVYTNMGLVGEMTGWGSDIAMTAYQATNNHTWYAEYTFATDSECKFRFDSNWDYNWGSNTFPWGLATAGGDNIPTTAGTYMVFFNDIDGSYSFIQK